MSTYSDRKRRAEHLTHRRQCGVCGCELPAYSFGRPPKYCAAETGRPCAAVVKTLTTLRTQLDQIAANAPSAKRETFLRGIRGTLRDTSQDLTLTVANLQGDAERAAAVGKVDPKGFFGD